MNDRALDIDLPRLREMAGKIVLGRAQFVLAYDPLATEYGSDEFKVLHQFADPGDPPYFAALVEASQNGWFARLLSELVDIRAFGSPPEAAPSIPPTAVELQEFVNTAAGMIDIGNLVPGCLTAVRRVCLVEVRTQQSVSYGTGFLVGPQVILTAWHVVRPLLDFAQGTWSPRAGTASNITVFFDKTGNANGIAHQVAENWLVDSSRGHELEVDASIAIADPSTGDATGFSDCLDFALLLLSTPAGRERGYYRLDKLRKPNLADGASKIFAFQHPGGMAMKISDGNAIALYPQAIETRLKHNANTMKGSSGGLIVDPSFRPIALHQCALLDTNGKVTANGAIPTASIAAKDPGFGRLDGIDPLWETKGALPVFGRLSFQQMVRRAIGGATRVFAVRGTTGSGRTFSITLLREMLVSSDHLVVDIAADSASHQALLFARSLLEKLGARPDEIDQLPKEEQAETALPAWLRDVLMPTFLNLAAKLAGARLVWVVLDDVEALPPTGSATHAFLDLLLSRVDQVSYLRLVLLGQTMPFDSLAPGLETERLSEILIKDVQSSLERWLVAHDHSPGIAETLAHSIYASATARPDYSTRQLARNYQAVVTYFQREKLFHA